MRVAFSLQVLLEEGKFHVVAEELARIGRKVDVTQVIAGGVRPASVIPGTHHNGVAGAWACRFNRSICFERTGKIFGIEPSAHYEYRGLDVFQMWEDVALLPVITIIRMRDLIAPVGIFIFEVLLVRVRERSQVAVELIPVFRAVIEFGFVLRLLRMNMGIEVSVKPEVGSQ